MTVTSLFKGVESVFGNMPNGKLAGKLNGRGRHAKKWRDIWGVEWQYTRTKTTSLTVS